MKSLAQVSSILIYLTTISLLAPYILGRTATLPVSFNDVLNACNSGTLKEDGTVQFLVYFDLDKAKLDQSNLQIVRIAAKCVTERNASSVIVVGHTDQVGSEIYNLSLSRKRTDTVVRTLRQNAVPTAIISVDWKGKFEPAVPSDNSKPEPLNRRAVITLTF
jgi:outer membrane protein OmpA-like peptidoglycan-associated protein